METPTFSSELNNQSEGRNQNNQQRMEETTPRKRRRYDSFGNGGNGDEDGEQRTPRRRAPLLLLPLPPPIVFRQNPLNNQPSKLPPSKIAYISSKIEEKLVDIEIESRKEIDKLFQKFSSQIRASVAANQNLQKQQKQNAPAKTKESESKK